MEGIGLGGWNLKFKAVTILKLASVKQDHHPSRQRKKKIMVTDFMANIHDLYAGGNTRRGPGHWDRQTTTLWTRNGNWTETRTMTGPSRRKRKINSTVVGEDNHIKATGARFRRMSGSLKHRIGRIIVW